MPVVTISRQFGAGGSSVAGVVAAELGCEVVDKFLIDEVARRLGFSVHEVEARIEHSPSWAETIVRSLGSLEPALGAGWMPPFPDPLYDPRGEITALTETVIHEVAASGNAVIVGRGAGFALRGTPGVLRVFLRAPGEACIKTLMARFGYARDLAQRAQRETNANRAAYVKQLYGADWSDPDAYDLIINTGRVSYASAAKMILAGARKVSAGA